MAELRLRRRFQFRDDSLGEHFAQLDAPLIEAVDVPDHALHEDRVLVERDQLAEHRRRQLLGENRVRRPIAGEHAMRHEPIRRAFGLHFLRRFAEGQRLGLGEDVGHQHVVMRPERVERLDEAR